MRSALGIRPCNIELYKLALVHRSASLYLAGGTPVNNERLEFLGDAILESVVSDYLFIEYPDRDEGFLTKMRSKIVNRGTMNELAVSMGLDRHIVSSSGGGMNVGKNINGDAMEAMIGAIYLDKGYNFTNRWLINRVFRLHLDLEEITSTESDHKSRLIEWCQKSHLSISFKTAFSRNSTTQHPMFQSQVLIDGDEMGYGYGGSKKEAEQCAAYSVSQALSDRIGDFLLESMDNRHD
ncbi:MAG: ribonuclease III [Rikenellaceae bacterium]|nr:ribonuclease III [Rikenellaceae bacterium]